MAKRRGQPSGPSGRRWKAAQARLPADHGWSARPGHKIFVADRGALRFDFPEDWSIEPGDDGSVRLRNRPEPDDDCTLDVSVLRAPIPLSDRPPLDDLLRGIGSSLEPLWQSEPHVAERPGAEYAWTETRYVDEDTEREAFSYSCIARGGVVHAVLTMTLWTDDVAWVRPIWDDVLETMQVGAEYDLTGRHPRRN